MFDSSTPKGDYLEGPATARFDGDVASDALDLLNLGLILLSPISEIIAANAAAAHRLRTFDGLGQEGGLLVAEVVTETALVRRAVLRTAETGAPDAVLIRRTTSPRPCVVVVRPVGHGEHRNIIIAVRDIGHKSPMFVDRVKALFRLAPAEADIAVQLTLGADLPEIAAARGVSINTIRTQMASAMVKVGVHRQAELVAVIAGIDMLL